MEPLAASIASGPGRLIRGEPPRVYAGHCLRCGTTHQFENDTARALPLLDELFHALAHDPAHAPFRMALDASGGKMIGVLLARAPGGEDHVLRAHSGEIANRTDWPGWVGPAFRREDTAALEAETLPRLAELTRRVDENDVPLYRARLEAVKAAVKAETAERRSRRWDARQARGLARRAGTDDTTLDTLRTETLEEDARLRAAEQARILQARREMEAAQERLRVLREERRQVSLALWEAMLDAAKLTNARGERVPLREVYGSGRVPGGTSDCAVPRLLEAANSARLRPLALAEAWWGPTVNGRVHGESQPPCERKCQPILGHLLCGRGG